MKSTQRNKQHTWDERREHGATKTVSNPKTILTFPPLVLIYSKFCLTLNHETAWRSWYSGVDGDPAITCPAFEVLRLQAEKDEAAGKKTLCCLMLDEMSRKNVEFLNGRYHGFVDIGNAVVDDSMPLAKDALVLTSVAVNGL
ncbi:THAP domain-containing protein 9-like protein [Plakobranchus ocellatus]|uniref:THAP domain-containing protein 9-like protein n=1 Tax=Plakobranchus ocellatus TaxID=259542 RepID=A0AAV3YNJ4_9GAST|nr:THAP domain-containing protein 9-like protein [Plakobranchus ocellatus]